MSSIDAVINAGPSAQQQEIDEPVEKFDALNVREDSEGWNDVEDDAEEFNVQCLFCSETATSLAQSLAHRPITILIWSHSVLVTVGRSWNRSSSHIRGELFC
jgi:hypothetical protein